MFTKFKIFIRTFSNRALLKLYSGTGAGYFTANFVGGKETGQPGRFPSLILNVGDWQLHFHHWFYALAILLSIFSIKIKNRDSNLGNRLRFFISSPLSGFLFGLIMHGVFEYDDWYHILIKKQDF